MNLNLDLEKVLYLLVCETVNTVCDTAVVYEPLIIRYGNFIPYYAPGRS